MATFNPDYESAKPEYFKDYPFSETIFPEDVPLCAKDLNEIQRNFGFQISSLAKNIFNAQGNESISFAPFSIDVVASKNDSGYSYETTIQGLLITPNHVFEINTVKTFTSDSDEAKIICLYPSITIVDEASTDITAINTGAVLPNYLSDNKFVEAITKREALSIRYGVVPKDDFESWMSIKICEVRGESVVVDEIITPKITYREYLEYMSLYDQPYIISSTDKKILDNTTSFTLGWSTFASPPSAGGGMIMSYLVQGPLIRVLWRGKVFTVGGNMSFIENSENYIVCDAENKNLNSHTASLSEDSKVILSYSGATYENVAFNETAPLLDEVPDSRAKRFYMAHSLTSNLCYVESEIGIAPDENETLIQRTSETCQIVSEDGSETTIDGHGLFISTRMTENSVIGLHLNPMGRASVQTSTIRNDGTINYDEPQYFAFKNDLPRMGQTTIAFIESGWKKDEVTGMFTQEVSVDGLLETDITFIDISFFGDSSSWEEQIDAYQKISKMVTSDKKIIAYCREEAPTATLNVRLTAMRSNTNFLN